MKQTKDIEVYLRFRKKAIKYGFRPFGYNDLPDTKQDAINCRAIQRALTDSLRSYPLFFELDIARVLSLRNKDLAGKEVEDLRFRKYYNNEIYSRIVSYLKVIGLVQKTRIQRDSLESTLIKSFGLPQDSEVRLRNHYASGRPSPMFSHDVGFGNHRKSTSNIVYLDFKRLRENLRESYALDYGNTSIVFISEKDEQA